MKWVIMNGLAWDNEALKEFKLLLKSYKEDPDKWNQIFTFDTFNNGWYYLDGIKKTPYISRK